MSVVLPDGRNIEYNHDPLGRRIAKKINGATVEKYLWQGLTRLLAVYDGSDNLIMRFEYADGRMPVAMTDVGSTYYLTYDQVGSLKIVADASGNVVKRVEYDSFGNTISDSNPTFEVPFGFAGGLHDRDTSMVRFGYRDYDPDVGRWTAKDPIFFAGGDTDLYGYCLGDPVNFIDPTGEFVGLLIGPAIMAAPYVIAGGLLWYALNEFLDRAEHENLKEKEEVFSLSCKTGDLESAMKERLEYLEARNKVIKSPEAQVGIPAAVTLGEFTKPQGVITGTVSEVVSKVSEKKK